MRTILRLGLVGALAYGAKRLYDRVRASRGEGSSQGRVGYDTPTGTDPAAKYTEPGFQDKSFGQAVDQDQQLAEQLAAETEGDVEEAEARFRSESAGAPVLERQTRAERRE